jgi:hypothetical protein
MPRSALHLLLFLSAIAVCLPAVAAPTDEIERAIAVTGATAPTAKAGQFGKAFGAVALRVQLHELPDYVIAAINLRPDLASKAVKVAVNAAVKKSETKPEVLCLVIERIVRAAIADNPDAILRIAKAAASAAPETRRCVIAGAVSASPETKEEIVDAVTLNSVPFAFLTFSGSDAGGFSFNPPTLNPANISELSDDDTVNSPEQPPVAH